MDDTEILRRQIRKCARKKAAKMARDDVRAMTEDLEMEGWIAWLSADDSDIQHRWYRVHHSMMHAACKWRFGIRYRAGLDFSSMYRDECEDIDLTPLMSLDPSVEEQVLGIELLRELERRLSKISAKTWNLLRTMIINGNTKTRLKDRLENDIGDQQYVRKINIRNTFLKIIDDPLYERLWIRGKRTGKVGRPITRKVVNG